jgi:ribosome-binding factor A
MLLFGMSIAILFIYFLMRSFALRAQDRAIRAEENFRHYLLTGKQLDQKLTMRQVVALRFAPDEEFVSLAQKAAQEGTKANNIKKAIQNWRGDFYRV